jgi:hypothetical protein
METTPSYSSRIDRLIIAFGCSRNSEREIGTWKHLKSSIFILQEDYKDLLDYKRDLWLFGPESSEYGNEFNTLLLRPGEVVNYSGLLSGYFFFRKRVKAEPIHHMYTLSRVSLAPFIDSLEKFSRDETIPNEIKEEFILDSIVRIRFIPPEITINESLGISDKSFWDETQYPNLEEELKTWPLPTMYDLETHNWTKPIFVYDKDTIDQMKEVYKTIGIILEPHNGNSKYIARISKNLSDRYDYLNPTRSEIRKKLDDIKFDWRLLDASIFAYLGMNNLIDGIDDFLKKLESKLERVKKEIKLEKLPELFKKEKKRCEEIFEASERANLYVQFDKNKVVFEISEELKEELKERSRIFYPDRRYHPTAYLYYYHALQPIELGMVLKKYGLNHVKEQLMDVS